MQALGDCTGMPEDTFVTLLCMLSMHMLQPSLLRHTHTRTRALEFWVLLGPEYKCCKHMAQTCTSYPVSPVPLTRKSASAGQHAHCGDQCQHVPLVRSPRAHTLPTASHVPINQAVQAADLLTAVCR